MHNLHWLRSTAHSDNLLHQLLLLQPDRLLHCDLAERVHRVLHAIRHHAGVVRLHSDLRERGTADYAAMQLSARHR